MDVGFITMASKKELDKCYMSVANAHAALSKAQRTKVGACIVTANGTVLAGCNGMTPGGENVLEDKVYLEGGEWLDPDSVYQDYPFTDDKGRYKLVTKDRTIHAELSCLLKSAKEGVSVLGATLYVSLSPCERCSEMIAAAGIKRVVYKDEYRLTNGVENLKNLNLVVEKYEE